MRRRNVLMAVGAVLAVGLGIAGVRAEQATSEKITVYKTSTCGCCSLWVKHLQANGFQVEAHDIDQDKLTGIAREAGVTADLQSCHTAKVGRYVVEGHVPAADIQRMLKERPAIAGISAPGMPMGSPGMEQGGVKQPYDVVAFTKSGQRSVFTKH
jgi:hypothetical protein